MTLFGSAMLAPMLDPEAVLASLPAAERAALAWAERPLERALDRLATDPLTEELVAASAADLAAPLEALLRATKTLVSSSRDELRAAATDAYRAGERELTEYLAAEGAREAARWAFGFLHSFLQVFLTLMDSERERERLADVSTDDLAATTPDVQGFMSGLAALIAAYRVVRRRGDPARAAELVELAFLRLRELRCALRAQGWDVAVFPEETVEQRHRRILAYADRLRDSLSDSDWEALRSARMQGLR